MKRILALSLTLACLLTTFVSAVSVTSPKVGGKTAASVTLEAGEIVSADVLFAQGSVNKDQAAADIVSAGAAQGRLLAAVNGGFFNAYYDKNAVDGYGKVARCQVNVVKNGTAVNGCGLDEQAVFLGFTKDGRPLIDELTITQYITFGDSKWGTWGVNHWYEGGNVMLLFTPEAGYDVPLPAGAKAAKIVNGVVTEHISAGTLACAANTRYFVCGSQLTDRLPAVGQSVSFVTEFSSAAWKDVVTAVSCGPWLLHDGKNVFSENSKYPNLSDAKVSETSVAQRTYAAILNDGKLVLGTVSASPKQITEYLIGVGAKDALLLDGGASSMLYADGRTLTAAGRKLNNVICLYGSAASTAPAAPAPAPARETVAGFTDVYADDYYADAVAWALEKKITTGMGNQQFGPAVNLSRSQAVTFLWRAMNCPAPKTTESKFSDVKPGAYYYNAVLWAAENGVTDGIGGGLFGVDNDVTRGQMITFLWRTMGKPNDVGGAWYESAENWAKSENLLSGTAQAYSTGAVCPRGDVVFYLWRELAK